MKPTRAIVAVSTCVVLLSACGQGGEAPDAETPTSTATVTETVTASAAAAGTVTETVTAPAAAAATVTETVTVASTPEAEEETEQEAEPADETEQDAEPAVDESEGQVAFGETWTWEDGTSVTVSEPEAFTPSEYASGGEGFDSHVQFTISVQNDTGAGLDLNFFSMTLQSGRSEGDQVFDSDNGMEGSPSTTLLDGRTVDFVAGFGVEDPDDLVLELAPTWDHDAAFFTN